MALGSMSYGRWEVKNKLYIFGATLTFGAGKLLLKGGRLAGN